MTLSKRYISRTGALLLYSIANLVPVLSESNLFIPRGIGQGITYDVKEFNRQDLVLNTTSDTITLDYGAITSGFPLVEVDATEGTGEVEILMTYSEGYPGLLEPFGDGPYMFSSMLSNNFRTEAINVTDILVNHNGLFQSYFIQGSQRWQSLKLVKGDGVRLKRIGFVPTSTTTQKQNESGDATSVDLNSTFECSEPMLERLWHLGPKSLQHACVSAGTQPTTWDRAGDGESGVFVRGQRAARLANVTGVLPEQYTLDFEVKVQRGGFGWQMDAGVGGTSRSFYVTTDLTEPMVPASWNRSLLSPNTLTLGAGFALVNQTTLPGYLYDRIPLDSIRAGQWIKVSTTSSGGSLYNISLDGQEVASVNTSSYGYLPGGSPFYLGPSTVALGGWQDQDAYYRNLVVSDGNGTVIYENNLNGDKVREEFGVATNAYSQCLDGPKRDRYVWLGDFYISATSLVVSTGDYDSFRGTIVSTLDNAAPSGGVGIDNPMGIAQPYAQAWVGTGAIILSDYQLDFLNTIALYYEQTGDLEFVRKHWNATYKLAQYAEAFINPDTQLWAPPSVFKGAPNGTASSAQFVWTWNNLAKVATALSKHNVSAQLQTQANRTAQAVSDSLWDKDAGVYNVSTTDGNFSYIDVAMTILSGISQGNHTSSQIANLDRLKYEIGYVESTAIVPAEDVALSTYKLSYLLEALGQAGETETAKFLLDNMYSKMAKPGPNYSGGSWEYILPNGEPGLSLFTSLAHPWGSGSTAFLTRYVLGIRPTTAAYGEWTFAPLDMGLDYAKGSLRIPCGTLDAAWRLQDGRHRLEITSPKGTKGAIVPPWKGTYRMNGQLITSSVIEVEGGLTVVIEQD